MGPRLAEEIDVPHWAHAVSPTSPLGAVAMIVRAVIVFGLLAAIIVPVILAEFRRARPRPIARIAKPSAPKPEAAAKPPLRLVVNRNDMDRELAALLARNSRKSAEPEE